MSESRGPIPLPRRPSEEDDRLDSWKEIARYLGREVRTVQGWEKTEGLPIHRHQHARQGSVYASRRELDLWREARKGAPEIKLAEAGEAPKLWRSRLVLLAGMGAVVLVIAGFLVWKYRTAAPRSAALSSIVVLPFLDLSPAKDQEYFSDGLTEEIIDALSRVPNLRVVARTSAFAFKGTAKDIRRIGQELNVSSVLEGSVRKAGDQLRITAQLNRVSDGYHLWSRTYDRQLRDVFAVQQEISQSIAGQLRAGQVPPRGQTGDLEAYNLYQEARYFFNQHEPPAYEKAIERYQQAIRRDPNFALAYAGLADTYAYLAETFSVAPREVMPKAKAAAEKAVALDENLAEAHTSLGIVKLDHEWDREGAQHELRQAMHLNPGSGYVHHWYAHSLEAQGHLAEAMQEMRASLALDPLSLIIYWDIGSELLASRQYDQALQHLDKANELYPNFPLISYERAEVYTQKGDLPAAHRVIETLKAAHPELLTDPPFMAFFAAAATREGHPAEGRKVLDRLERIRKTRYVEPFMVLELCSALGDRERLKLWVNRAYEERSTLFVYAPLLYFFYNNDPGSRAFFAQAH